MGWKSFLYIYWIYDIDVFSSPHYLGPEIGRQMMPYDYMLITRFRVTWQQWLEKTKYRYYNEDSISVFEFSDVWFRRNIEYKTATFFQVCCVCLRIGRWMTSCDYTPTVPFRVIWQQWFEKTKYRFCNEDSISVFKFLLGLMVQAQYWIYDSNVYFTPPSSVPVSLWLWTGLPPPPLARARGRQGHPPFSGYIM